MRAKNSGFTLVEVLIAIFILAGGILMVTLSWSGTFNKMRKATLLSDVATLLERKMVETEAKYAGKDIKEIPEEEEGDFGSDHPQYRWKLESNELTFPDISAIIVGQNEGGDEMLLTMIKQMTEYLSKTIKEVKITVYVKTKAGREMEFAATQYFIDYNQDFAGALGGGGGQAPAGGP